jgi:hypothetical protein
MAVLFSASDLIPVQIADCVFYFSPLKQGDKLQMIQKFQGMGDNPLVALEHSASLIKATLKRVEGIERSDGTPWKLQFDANGKPSDESLDELFSLDFIDKVIMVGGQFLRGVPQEGHLIDPSSGNPIEGIEVKKIQR